MSISEKGKSEDIATMARRLRVAHLLEGSVRKSGNRLRAPPELSSLTMVITCGRRPTTTERERSVFKVQDEIAGAVVAALKLKLAPEQPLAHPHREYGGLQRLPLGKTVHQSRQR